MAKAPRARHAKTRLTSALAPDVAADLYRHFLLDTIAVVRRIPGVTPALVCPCGDRADLLALDSGLSVIEQEEPGLMQGLAYGIAYGLEMGHPAVALINADSPTLPPQHISRAFDALASRDVVLGPTADGGYYLIAANVSCTRLLCEVPYHDAATICAETLARASALGLRATTIAPWFDVDVPSELGRLAAILRDAPPHVAPHTRRALVHYAAEIGRLLST